MPLKMLDGCVSFGTRDETIYCRGCRLNLLPEPIFRQEASIASWDQLVETSLVAKIVDSFEQGFVLPILPHIIGSQAKDVWMHP